MNIEDITFKIEHEGFLYSVNFRHEEGLQYRMWVSALKSCETLLNGQVMIIPDNNSKLAITCLLEALGEDYSNHIK